MKPYEMTQEQQSFAAENHNLIYTFLRDRRLNMEDYYDIVVFGYLEAVRRYCNLAELRKKYAFSTIAWRKMKDELYKHFEKQSRCVRKVVTVSLDSAYGKDSELSLSDIISGPDYLYEEMEADMLWDDITGILTKPQAETLRMRADGYSVREIAAARRSPLRDIEDLLDTAISSVRSLCLT